MKKICSLNEMMTSYNFWSKNNNKNITKRIQTYYNWQNTTCMCIIANTNKYLSKLDTRHLDTSIGA